MPVTIQKITPDSFPPLLNEINDAPDHLYVRGNIPQTKRFLCVVGSRKYSSYGKHVVEELIGGLAGHSITIVSGLALGIDAHAHRAALKAGLPTVAVPGSGLAPKVLYPASHRGLADKILESDGALISEYEPEFKAAPWSFPKRNRIMAGLSHATLVVEAEMKSGTLITARLAMEYNRDVCAVPGSIFSKTSAGTHHLITNGAHAITSADDLADVLDLKTEEKQEVSLELTDKEKVVYDLLDEPLQKDELIEQSELQTHEANIALTTLELKGAIKEELGKVRRIL